MIRVRPLCAQNTTFLTPSLDDINIFKLNGMIGSMEETFSSAMAYENKSAAELAHSD